jgi:hypothetical protein
MSVVSERDTMAKSKGRPRTDRDDVTIRVGRPLASKLRAIATDKGVTVGEIADELCAGAVDKAYAKMLRELDKEGTAK